MTAKTPTPQGISALLRKAGFSRSVPRPGHLVPPTEGYRVLGQVLGKVSVEHLTGFDRGANAAQRRKEMFGKYAEVIRAAGWQVTEEVAVWHALIVTAGDGGPSGRTCGAWTVRGACRRVLDSHGQCDRAGDHT